MFLPKFAQASRQKLLPFSRAYFATTSGPWPSFLTKDKGAAIDVITAESTNILFNLATEEYIFEHCEVQNPILFLWRNSPTIIIGKH